MSESLGRAVQTAVHDRRDLQDAGRRKLRGGQYHGVCYAIDQQGGKNNARYAEDVMMTIMSDSHGTPHAVCYGISAYGSNAMRSSNPHSGVYEADTSRTLDLNCCNPACNQGGGTDRV